MSALSPLSTFITNNPSILLVVALFVILLYIIYLHYKISRLTQGKTGASLEDVIRQCVSSVQKIEERNELISKHALTLDERVSHSIRNAKTMRYKAFETNSSNQSFSVALLNERGDGVIISSLHAHERMSTFAKPVEHYESKYELTDEEKTVLDDAKKAHKETSALKA